MCFCACSLHDGFLAHAQSTTLHHGFQASFVHVIYHLILSKPLPLILSCVYMLLIGRLVFHTYISNTVFTDSRYDSPADVIEYYFLYSITFPQKFPYNMFIYGILAFHLAVVSNGSKLSLSVWMTTKAVRRPEKKVLVGRALLWHFFSPIV